MGIPQRPTETTSKKMTPHSIPSPMLEATPSHQVATVPFTTALIQCWDHMTTAEYSFQTLIYFNINVIN